MSQGSSSRKSRKDEFDLDTIAKMSDKEYLNLIGHHKPGSILKIELSNFLTYKSVVIKPGSRLNVVAGANGTGKSTILNAICLGLGGEPKLLGRAEDVRDFIMHGETIAEIKITLAPHPGQETHVIMRMIDRKKGSDKGKGRGSSSFAINGEKATIKEVQELVRDRYLIAIENMCTFLPQDKVGGFSALTPQELLVETEKVLDKEGFFINMHRQLMLQEDTINDGESNVEALQSKMKKLKHENEQLERAKNVLEEREHALRQLDLLKKKQLWLVFDATREEAVILKERRQQIKIELRQAQQELEPLQTKAESFESRIKQIDSRIHQLNERSKSAMKECDKNAKKFEKHDEDLDRDILELGALDEKRATAEENVRICQENVDRLRSVSEHYSNQEQLKEELNAATGARKIAQINFNEAKSDSRRLAAHAKELDDHAQMHQRTVAKLSDTTARRREVLYRHFNVLAKITKWLDNHRDRFRRPVIGPIAAEISPSTPEAAAFIEQHVPNNTLKAFCVETKEDRDFFYEEVRVKLGIPVNIILLSKRPRKPRVYSNEQMRAMGQYGIQGFLDELFDAPEIVMQALIDNSSIDRVLVGDQKTYNNMKIVKKLASEPHSGQSPGKSPGQIGGMRSFVICCTTSDKKQFKFQGTKSRYANQISMRQDDVSPARILSPGVDPSALKSAKDNLSQAHQKISELRPEISQSESNMREAESAFQDRGADVEVAKRRLEEFIKIENKFKNAIRKLNEANEVMQGDDDKEKKLFAKSIMNRITHAITAIDVRSQQFSLVLKASAEDLGITANKTCLIYSQRVAEMALFDKKNTFDELQKDAERVNKEFQLTKQKLVELNNRANREAPIADKDGNDLPLRKELDDLGVDSLEQAEVAIEDLEAKANSIDANPDVIRQYQARCKEIEELEDHLSQMVQDKADKTAQLNRNRERWESNLEEQITVMNRKFIKYMASMGNAGELVLYRGEPDENGNYGSFKDWGIKILVSFRGESKSRVLSAQSHSGGERAVSTIIYLMAAQDMLVSPFRCVDEINQGLDERNERLVFSRIVANSCSRPGNDPMDHTGQYFLITPKLLPNLEGMEHPGITILTVFNGPFNDIEEFHIDDLLRVVTNKRDLNDEQDDENSGNIGSRPQAHGTTIHKKSRLVTAS